MNKKKNKKIRPQVSKPVVRLSQCMIVKNEEKNINRALSWAKKAAFEQIVVDTGSTDRTVEIAESMGAKVFHIDWINDFAVAKNYAIEQATGNWIAFLDADEYLSPEDTDKLMVVLKEIEENPEMRNNVLILSTPLINLDDRNRAFSVYRQRRIFRNMKNIRYTGRIHEALTVHEGVISINDISIIHTGYASSSYSETSKHDRNIGMLREELEKSPDDIDIKAYLADSLNNRARLLNPGSPGEDPEADILYKEVIESSSITRVMKKKAYMYFIQKYVNDPFKFPEYEILCKQALDNYSNDLDFSYFYACALNKKKQYSEAWEILKNLEQIAKSSTNHGETIYITADPGLLYEQMLGSAQGLGDIENIINYATVILMLDNSKERILRPYISTLVKQGITIDGIVDLLGKVYDFNNVNELMLIARAAKDCGVTELSRLVMAFAGELLGKE